MKCDFCSAVPVVRAYRTPDFVMQEAPDVQKVSVEGWAACAECAGLIAAGDPEAVIDHAVDRIRANNPDWRRLPRHQARSLVAEIQQRFFALLAIGEVTEGPLPE